jgi:hypothetical protein
MEVVDSILDDLQHARLILDMESVCAQANVPAKFIHQSAKNWCGPGELDWIAQFHSYRTQYAGLCIEGGIGHANRCMAVAGALLRNFIDARVYNLNALIEEKGEVVDPTVLLIPNLCFESYGKTLPAHEVQKLYDVLLKRFIANRPTVVCIESMKGLEQAYGALLSEHVRDNFKII